MPTNPFLGLFLHSIGAFSSSSCYTPQKQTKLWAWEVYWITTASFAWLILPIAGAFLTIPNYLDVLAACETKVMLRSLGLGVIYGVGGLTFGLGIRYIGFSLNYAIAIGISAGLGTLFPLIWHPNKGFIWEIVEKFSSLPGQIVLAGIVISLGGIAVCGWAGMLRERAGGDSPTHYSFRVGVPLAIVAGVLSSVYKFALDAGDPLAYAATAAGANDLLKMNAIYPFSNGGAFITNFAFCVFLIARNRTGGQFLRLPKKGTGTLGFYYLMGLLSGAFWYFQFFFYGMGHHHMGDTFGFTSWALHMAMLILFSNVYGWLFREWEGVSTRPRRVLHVGMAVIVVATLIITCGNYLEAKRAQKALMEWAAASESRSVPAGFKSVDGNELGQLWAINTTGNVVLVDGDKVEEFPVQAIDIGCGLDGTVAIVSPDGLVRRKADDQWVIVPGLKNVRRVAVGPEGHIGVIHDSTSIALFDGTWHQIPGGGEDIGCGPDGMIAVSGYGRLWIYRDGQLKDVGGSDIERVSVTPKTGHCLVVNEAHEVFAYKDAWMPLSYKATDVGSGKSNDDEIIAVIQLQ